MNDREQPPPHRRRSSTTARWALFFALVACVISSINMILIWRDGELVRNARMLTEEVGRQLDKRRAEATPAASAATAEGEAMRGLSPAAGETLEGLRWRLERVGEMIRDGDTRARFHLDVLSEDLEKWTQEAGRHGGAWLEQTRQAVGAARQEMAGQAPAAADRLVRAAADLRERLPRREIVPAPQEVDAPADNPGATD